MKIIFGHARTMKLPPKDGKLQVMVITPWKTDQGHSGTIHLLKDQWSEEKALAMIIEELNAAYYQIAGKEVDVE